VARPHIGDSAAYYGNHDALVWGADDTKLYATNDYISTGEEDIYTVDAQGVTLSSSTNNVLSTFVQHMAFDPATGRLFDDQGGVVNATTEASSGTLPYLSRFNFLQNPSFVLDTAQRKAFYVSLQAYNTYDSVYAIQAFDMDQYKPLNEIVVPLTGFTGLTRWGSSGLAISDGSQIILIDGSFVSPSGTSSALGTYVAPSPTVSSVSPAAVLAGSPDTQLTLTGKDFSLATTVTWNNQTLPLDAVTDTQLTVTVPAAMLTAPAASLLTVTNGPGTLPAPSLAFSVLPDLGPTAQLSLLNLAGSDAAWDPTRNLLYVSVPYTDPTYANSIAVVDPSIPAIKQVVPVLDQPGSLSLTSDAAYLYIGSYTNPLVERFALPAFSLDLTIPLGSATFPTSAPAGGRETCTFAVDIKAAPGSPHTVAVEQGNNGIEPRGCGGLTIYDDTVQRANALSYSTGGEQDTIVWGLDASTLFGQTQDGIEPQTLSDLAVTSTGVSVAKYLNGGSLGLRLHFDPGTGYLFSDSGIITNPANNTQVGNLASGLTSGFPALALPDSVNKHVFLLVTTSSAAISGIGNYELEIFNLPSLTLANTLQLPNLVGQPWQMVRWGTQGLAITTKFATGPGALYLLQGTAFTAQ
jgi:flagellar hook protein FlgE